MVSLPELLAPVQNWHALKIIERNADAIYFGVDDYNMRAKANNFKREDLLKIAEFCQDQEPIMKAYLCTNILVYNNELQDLENLISEAKDARIDAIIAHDIAAIQIAKKQNMNFHISTQANVSNIESAKFYEDLGAQRIILARELSLKQIKEIKNSLKKTEIECFVHGAMCTSISGRCYLSTTICDSEEFSANRGKCVQPCRRKWRVIDDDDNELIYDGLRFLNSKDLCMIEYIPELIEANIDSFKIEGRMKDPLYAKIVVKCYREAIDSYHEGTYTSEKVKEWINRLSKVFNRGFHSGFYFHRPTIEEVELEEMGNISPYKRVYIGKIVSFNKSSMTANVLIENRGIQLKSGREVLIKGMDTYHFEIVKKIFVRGKEVKEVVRINENEPLKVNIRLTDKVIPEEKIFILTKNKNLKV
jgi:putative protease